MSKIPIFLIAGYTRISLDEAHQRYSLSAQGDRIREYIKSHSKDGYLLYKIYSDQKSGGSLDRPGLQELLKDAEEGRFQAILSERRGNLSLRRSNSSNYLLSGLLHCERSGGRLVGKCAHGRRGIYSYYVCQDKLRYGECDLDALPQVAVDEAILLQIEEVFQNEALIKRILSKVKVKLNKKLPKKVAELKSLEREMQRKETITRRYRGAFEVGSLDAQEFGFRVSELNEEIQLLRQREVQLKDELINLKVQPVTFKDIQEMMERFEKVIMSAPPSETKAFLRRVIKTIKVHSVGFIEPYYRLPVVRIMSGLVPLIGRVSQLFAR